MKWGKIIFVILMGIFALMGVKSCFTPTYITHTYSEGKIKPVTEQNIRIHAFALGGSEAECVADLQQELNERIPEYQIVEIKTFEFKSDGKPVWVCEGIIDISKSLLADPTPPKQAF